MMVQAIAGGSLRPACRRMWGVVLLLAVAAVGPGCAQENLTTAAVLTDRPSPAPFPTAQTGSVSLSPNASTASATTGGNSSPATPDATTAALDVTEDRANASGVATTISAPPAPMAATTATAEASSLQSVVGTTAESSESTATVTERLTTTPSQTLSPERPTTATATVKTKGSATPAATSTPTGQTGPQGRPGNVALYLLLPVVIIAAVAVLVMIVSCLRKRIRLDKLRHQLLPLYNFDPQEGEDWETELLTEPRPSSQTPLNTTKPLPTTTAVAEIPKLRFSPDTVDV